MPLTPRPAGLVGSSATGLLALSGALAAQAQLAAAAKEDRAGGEAEGPRGEWAAQGGIGQGDKGGEGDWQATLSRAPNSLKCEGVSHRACRALGVNFTPNWLCVLGRVTARLWASI